MTISKENKLEMLYFMRTCVCHSDVYMTSASLLHTHLEDVREVPEIENVVELDCCRQEGGCNLGGGDRDNQHKPFGYKMPHAF